MTKKLISTLPPLTPTQTINLVTGEISTDWVHPVMSLLSYVKDETVRLYENHSVGLFEAFDDAEGRVGSANSFARQRGITSAYHELPKEVKAKSRVNELVLHKLVSESLAYHVSSNPHKQAPKFSLKINLGAVDKQMVTCSVEDNTLWLEWKVWDQHLLFEFNIPDYILKRDITKWSLPTVQTSKKTGSPVFYFTTQENPTPLKPNHITAGVDLGRQEPFTLAILNHGVPVKKITTRHRLKELAHKRERLIQQKKETRKKLTQYEALGYSLPKQDTLREEISHLTSKTRRIGQSYASQAAADLTQQLKKYNVTILHLENLKFVTGKKYGGRWNHAAQQEAITHALTRAGIMTKKINPAGSSQHCHACGTIITHNTKTRTIRCKECQIILDRDFNAALNIAKNNTYPHSYSKLGDDCSSSEQVMGFYPELRERFPLVEGIQLS